MKKRKSFWIVIALMLTTLSVYLSFYSKIETKPSDAGFWIILALGMIIGVSFRMFFQLIFQKN
jgi:membrane protein CcdC involved in cytochrome C biogenesis